MKKTKEEINEIEQILDKEIEIDKGREDEFIY